MPTDWRPDSAHAMLHPRAPDAARAAAELPTVCDPQTGAERIGCRTCHDPHVSADYVLRGNAGAAQLCTTCHTDMRPILETVHGPAALATADLKSAACAPCHVVHGDANAVQSRLMWPTALLAAVDDSTKRAPPTRPRADSLVERAVIDDHCLACHQSGGVAHPPAVATHPVVSMFSPPTPADTALPLFAPDGRPDAAGQLTCRTCHLPHGRNDAPAAATSDADVGTARPTRMLLRPFVAPNLCTSCHAADGLRRYLYFHDTRHRPRVGSESPAATTAER